MSSGRSRSAVLYSAAVLLPAAMCCRFLIAQTGAATTALQSVPAAAPAPAPPPQAGRTYVGSKACESCHEAIYTRWSKTRMANVVLDPKQHPEAVIPDFSKPDPLLTFSLGDVAFVYGSKWKQRYFTKVGDEY